MRTIVYICIYNLYKYADTAMEIVLLVIAMSHLILVSDLNICPFQWKNNIIRLITIIYIPPCYY